MCDIEETTTTTTTRESSGTERLTGCVKWFNKGYGFITVTDGLMAGSDIFVHHSAIDVSSNQFKYLVQGEYIEFSLASTKNSNHEFQAANVTGIKGGKLMYETRRDFTNTRDSYKKNDTNDTNDTNHDNKNDNDNDEDTLQVKMPRQRIHHEEDTKPRTRQNPNPRQKTIQSQEKSSRKPRTSDGSWSKV